MADIKKIKLGDTSYDVVDGVHKNVIILEDNSSGTAGTWLAKTSRISAYADGQVFLYKVPIAGASGGTTLNINSLGAKNIYRGGSTKLTTHYGVGSYVLLYYSASLNSGSFMLVNDYATDNDKKTASGNTSSKIYLIGATSQSSSGQTTYSHDTVYVDTDGHLYCNGKKVSHVGHTHEVTTANAAPHTHTHNVTVSGTTGANSGTAVAAVTGVGANGTATVLTGVKASSTDTFLKDVTEGSGSLEAYDAATGGNKKVSNGTRIGFITSLSKSGYTPAGSVNLTPGTAPSMGDATTKYLSASASGTAVGANGTGSVAPSGHTHTVTVSGTTGANSGTAVKAVTGYSSFSGGSLTGTKTFNTDAIKSIGGTKNYGFSASTSNVMYSPTVSNGVLSWSVANASTQDAHTGTAASTGTVGFTAASLGTASTADVAPAAHTHSYGSSTALTTSGNSGTAVTALTGVKVTTQPTITLTANTSDATGRIKYVEVQGTFTAGTTPKASASFSGTKSTDVVTGGTTYYLAHTHSPTTEGTTASAVTAVAANGTATALTGVKAIGTANVAPHTHTHTFSDEATTEANSGTAVAAVTSVAASED